MCACVSVCVHVCERVCVASRKGWGLGVGGLVTCGSLLCHSFFSTIHLVISVNLLIFLDYICTLIWPKVTVFIH